MESITRGERHRCCRWIGVLLLCLVAGPSVAAAQGGGVKPDVNVVQSVKAVSPAVGPAVVEIEVRSSKEFPVRDEIVTLRIGNAEFRKSRSPAGGRLDTLIFILTDEEFQQVTDGDTMTVQYGMANTAGPRWSFGKLNKSLLQR